MSNAVESKDKCLAGKVVLVTGAASGIGAAIAEHFAIHGAQVLLHTRQNRVGLEQVAQRVTSHEVVCHTIYADLSTETGQDFLIKQALNWRGTLDILINNAGADVLTGEAAKWTFERKLEQIWQVDVLATMRLARALGRTMYELNDQQDRCILNMGWDQAWQGMEGDSGEMFAASKGAIMSFSKSLAQSLAPRVRVNCLAPGWIRTAWGQEANAAWQTRAQRESLQARWGTPHDVAAAALFLASPAGQFINGHILPVNGGFRYGAGTQ
jgi:3-oxoacyl-[acyl-carrier protein] reductase